MKTAASPRRRAVSEPRAEEGERVGKRGKKARKEMGFGPTYVAHIPPLEGWYSRDSLCYGVGARVAYITAKSKMFFGGGVYLPTCNPDPSHLVAERGVAPGVRISPSLGSTELGVGLPVPTVRLSVRGTERAASFESDKP